MGVWLSAKGRLEVVPHPNDELLIDFWRFSRNSWPEDYERMDERFANTWFFDENNRLACTAGKFAEPCVWYDWMKEHFFAPKGYELIGDMEIIGEDDPDIFNEDVLKEYYAWEKRASKLIEERCSMLEGWFTVRAGDIKAGHIYNVIFDPVRDCEFDGKHLAVVLKKNNDKSTFVVMPLTSSPNGNGINKIFTGKILTLPSSLRTNDTYAVLNQIRTLNASRFISLKEGRETIDVIFAKEKLHQLMLLAVKELVYSMDQDSKISLFKTAYEQEWINKAKDIAYRIKSLERNSNDNSSSIMALEKEIKRTLTGISYSLEQKYIDDGIEEIFRRALEF